MFNWFKKNKDKKEMKQEEVGKEKYIEEIKEGKTEESKEEIIVEEKDDSILDSEEIKELSKEVEKETNIEKITEAGIEGIDENEKESFLGKLFGGLSKTRKEMSDKIGSVLLSYKKIDEELFEDLEEILITADVGVTTTMNLIDRVRESVKKEKINDPKMVKDLLKDEIKLMMKESVKDNSLNIEPSPSIMLVVGVNGVGKTTTIGKLSNNFKNDGKKVLIAAADTFRAAAIEQLEEWSNRSGVEFIAHNEGADPAAVIFDGIHAAKARKTDILICDTAGRLHNKSNLMQELNKIFRIVEREYADATKEVLLVLDATTGQNAINQAKVFKEVAHVTGIALTKLDGTAKGGVVIALQSELGIPIKLIGVGEGIDDLQKFDSDNFVNAIFE